MVGAAVGVCGMAAGVWLILRRRRRRAVVNPTPNADGRGSGMHEVDPFPHGPSVIQSSAGTMPATGYVSKDRQGYGLVSPLSSEGSSSRPTALDSFDPPSTSAEESTTSPGSPGNALETALTRAIQQVVDRIQMQDAPPSYTGQ